MTTSACFSLEYTLLTTGGLTLEKESEIDYYEDNRK